MFGRYGFGICNRDYEIQSRATWQKKRPAGLPVVSIFLGTYEHTPLGLPGGANSVETKLPSVMRPIRRPVTTTGFATGHAVRLVLELVMDRCAGRIADTPLVIAHKRGGRRQYQSGGCAVLPIAIVAVPSIRLGLLVIPVMFACGSDASATIRVVRVRVVLITHGIDHGAATTGESAAFETGDILSWFLSHRNTREPQGEGESEEHEFSGHDQIPSEKYLG